jgi:hypothetical protein
MGAAAQISPLWGEWPAKPVEGGARRSGRFVDQQSAPRARAPHGGLAPACSPQRGEILS